MMGFSSRPKCGWSHTMARKAVRSPHMFVSQQLHAGLSTLRAASKWEAKSGDANATR